MTAFIAFLFTMIILKFRNTLMISSIAYLVIGVVIFFYMLIDQLKSYSTPTEARPPSYFDDHIDTIIIISNILTGFLRITGSIMIMFFITILKIEKKRNESEKNESLMKISEEFNKDNTLILNDSSTIEVKRDSIKEVKPKLKKKNESYDDSIVNLKHIDESAKKVR
jgi:hypothetical protein